MTEGEYSSTCRFAKWIYALKNFIDASCDLTDSDLQTIEKAIETMKIMRTNNSPAE
jgi:hypothetical protein